KHTAERLSHNDLFHRDCVSNWVGKVRRHANVLCHTPVPPLTRCVRPAGLIGFGIIEHNRAEVWASGTTRSAPAAWRVLINRNQITDSQVVYIGADLNDFAAELVSKDDARLRRVSRRNIQNVQV